MTHDGELLQADRHARRAALDISRSCIVQAPAGSGKTELLIQRYLGLLAVVEHPEEVLAITFTRKAAQEMQQRALAAMRDASNGVVAHEAHNQVTLAAAHTVLERDREMAWRILESPARLRIQTLDSLNAGIARSLPFSSGMAGGGRIVTDDELQTFYRAAAGATLDWLVTESEVAVSVEQVLEHLDNDTALYISYIARMLATRDQWLTIVGGGSANPVLQPEIRRSLERGIAREVTARLQHAGKLLPDEYLPLLAALCRYAGDNLDSGEKPGCVDLRECHAFPTADAGHVQLWRSIASLLLTQAGGWRRSLNLNDGFPPRDNGEKKQMLGLLQQLAAQPGLEEALQQVRTLPDPRYSDEQWSVLTALFRLLPVAVAELRRLFSERGVTDHTEVAMAAEAALGSVDEPGDIGLLLDYSIRHLLIDEMQDTSLAQYRLLERLVAGWEPGDGRTLFCVGDPMQSIYRFRDAEVGQFLLARQNGIGPVALEPLVLRQNFRSGEHLVHWFNTVFGQILPATDDVACGAIAYAASVPVDSLRGAGSCEIHPLFDASNEAEAEYAVAVIRRCIALSPDQTTAVLVRSRTQLPILLARLREAGVPYRAVDIDRLTDLPEIIDLLALTRALAHRCDRTAWLGLLRGPWAGLDWSDLHSLVRNDSRLTVWELLHEAERIESMSSYGQAAAIAFRDTMAPLIEDHGASSLRDTVENAWFRLRGPLLLQNAAETRHVYRFLDVLESIDASTAGFDVATLGARLDQERISGHAAADCRLHIMTMHKAKGLQFDHVVAYGLGRAAKGDQKSILSWLNVPGDDGTASMLISPVGARAELENDALHTFIEAAERDRNRLEQDRLLYVTCTRARLSVHLIGHVALDREADGFHDPPNGTLLQRLWPAVRGRFDEAFRCRIARTAAEPRATTESGRLRLPVLRRLSAKLPQAPELPNTPATSDPAVNEQPVEFYWVGAIARHAGTILHRLLHRIATARLASEVAILPGLAPLIRNWAREIGVPDRDLQATCDRALLALRRILEDAKGRWILSGDGHAELPVSGLWRDRIESVVIDRIRIDDGVHWIIDYKTSTHEGSDLSGFLRQESERYRQQLARYAVLYRNLHPSAPPRIRTALYFPLLQEFLEVPIDSMD